MGAKDEYFFFRMLIIAYILAHKALVKTINVHIQPCHYVLHLMLEHTLERCGGHQEHEATKRGKKKKSSGFDTLND